MMLGYNEQKRSNYFHIDELVKWNKQQWISDLELNRLDEYLKPRYKRTNIFVNIGLFVLTSIIINSALGFMGLLFIGLLDFDHIWFPALVAGSLTLIGLQRIVIDDKNQFRTGADDATLYHALGFFYGFFFALFEDFLIDNELIILGFTTLFFGITAYIYLDRLLTALTILTALGFLFFLLFRLGGIVTLLMPFVMMIVASLGYFFSLKRMKNAKSKVIEECFEIAYWIFIALFYLSGNYFVVIELSAALDLTNSFPILIVWFLYAFTIVVPILYIIFGLKHKEASLLNFGLLAVALSVATLRYYHSSMSIELELIIGGLLLVGIAWVALKYWSSDKGGITLKPNKNLDDGLKIESLLIDQALSDSSTSQSFTGGGGEFGGGGASGDF